MTNRERVSRPDPVLVPRTGRAPAPPGSAEAWALGLQRQIGNRATLIALGVLDPSLVARKVDKTATVGEGPIADVADSALSGTAKTRAQAALALIDANTVFAAHPYVVLRTSENGGIQPKSVTKNFRWGIPHANVEGHLPGVKAAGGYLEYYILSDTGAPSKDERLVVRTATKDVFHTATHYGGRGSPAFTHFRAGS